MELLNLSCEGILIDIVKVSVVCFSSLMVARKISDNLLKVAYPELAKSVFVGQPEGVLRPDAKSVIIVIQTCGSISLAASSVYSGFYWGEEVVLYIIKFSRFN